MSKTVFKYRVSERQCSVRYCLLSPSTFSESGTSILQVKYHQEVCELVYVNSVPLSFLFLFLFVFFCCSTTASRQKYQTVLTWKVKLVRKITQGFLWSQKGKTRSKRQNKIRT